MAMAFVANSAPSGWKLGRWSQTSPTTWQEQKLDNSKIAYEFQLVNGPSSFNGSTTVRLKLKGQNTEVLLLESSAQVFVNGSYFGEYGGSWERGGAGSKNAPRAAAPPASAPPSKQASKQEAEITSKRPSKQQDVDQGASFEETQLPASMSPQKAKPQKAAPPPQEASRKSSREPIPAAPAPAAMTIKTMPALPELSSRPRKPDGLDKSDGSMKKLIDAAKNGDVAKVSELLASGVDPDGPAKDGSTPLMAACRGGHTKVVEALCDAFADPVLGKGDETPMTIAFQKGNQDLLKVLFKASFNSLDSSIRPGAMGAFPDAVAANQEVPETAEQELREVTKMIAGLNKEKPSSPSAHKKYGNYAHMATNAADDAEKDSDMMREQSVRLAMKSLIKTANAEITGMDDFK